MSVFDNFIKALGSPGTKESVIGKFGQGISDYSALKTQATGFDIESMMAASSQQSLQTQYNMLGVKREEIDLDTVNLKVASYQKWLARRGAVKAGFAARGIKIDVSNANDTPALIMAQMLANIDEETRQIELNRRIRIFNEVSMPGYQIQSQMSRKRYEQDIAAINERMAERSANVALLRTVANTIYGVYTGYSAPKTTTKTSKPTWT